MADVDVQYLPIANFPGYRIGSDGTVWSCWRRGGRPVITSNWRQLKLKISKHGYVMAGLKRPDGYHWLLVHRLVLEMFIGPCPDGHECRHFPDNNRQNNNLCNLSWGTRQENADDKQIHGTTARGEKIESSKLTESEVASIRRMYASGGFSQTEIALRYGVTQANVSEIVRRKTWNHLVELN